VEEDEDDGLLPLWAPRVGVVPNRYQGRAGFAACWASLLVDGGPTGCFPFFCFDFFFSFLFSILELLFEFQFCFGGFRI
jgi:hypothetical protein